MWSDLEPVAARDACTATQMVALHASRREMSAAAQQRDASMSPAVSVRCDGGHHDRCGCGLLFTRSVRLPRTDH